MKKTYIQPAIDCVEIDIESLMNNVSVISQGPSGGTGNGTGADDYAKDMTFWEGDFDDDNEYEF